MNENLTGNLAELPEGVAEAAPSQKSWRGRPAGVKNGEGKTSKPKSRKADKSPQVAAFAIVGADLTATVNGVAVAWQGVNASPRAIIGTFPGVAELETALAALKGLPALTSAQEFVDALGLRDVQTIATIATYIAR